ncbi:MAG TPA: hypothetical protein VFF73_24385, partial [Planctomycetota bacterium]|nr:hypothetical protein [Planctomycetota bacterium]
DMGFEGKVPHATWHAIAHRARAGRFEETLLTAVGEIGQELTKTFPARERVERKPHPPRVRA